MRIAVIGSFLIAILHSILFYGQNLGLSVLLFSIAIGIFLIYILYKNNKIKNTKALKLIIPILLISATYLIFNNKFLGIFNIIILIILFSLMIVMLLFEKTNIQLIIKKILYLILGPIEFVEESFSSIIEQIKNLFKKKKSNKKSKMILKKIILGIVISIPLIVIVLMLLSSADQIFSDQLQELFKKIFNLNIFTVDSITNLIFRIIIIVFISIYLIALMYNIIEDNFCDNDINEIKIKKIDKIIGNTILIILNIIYLIFCYIQISVLFMNVSNIDSFNYANYARQGFFQLMAVSIINLIIILITSRKNNNKLDLTKLLNIILALFTIIILISSFYRMYLYEQEYGYTFLRLIVYFALATEAILIIPTIMYILGIKINLPKIYFVVILVMYIIINYINIDNVIAKKNIDKYLEDNKNYEIDVQYLQTLSIDAIPQLERLLNINDENIKQNIEIYFQNQKNNLQDINICNFNINRIIAKNILNKY